MKIDKNVVPLKNLLGLSYENDINDLLYEIASFVELDNENVTDDQKLNTFNTRSVSLKTKTRINETLDKDLDELERLGYIKLLKNTTYKLLKHRWE